jgi:hypothetical protein
MINFNSTINITFAIRSNACLKFNNVTLLQLTQRVKALGLAKPQVIGDHFTSFVGNAPQQDSRLSIPMPVRLFSLTLKNTPEFLSDLLKLFKRRPHLECAVIFPRWRIATDDCIAWAKVASYIRTPKSMTIEMAR